ncbi:Regulating synaptic membrane exocytosis protein 2 [Trichoplax sp. H2]|nr:Regulating synaptic membrane exocytosis protein 2 [Trichoplax sp. H2]|eukprot:RDD47753.1 Regulating synaptic membrane exocytosis protein 2 [Trichoplax sp. H2]
MCLECLRGIFSTGSKRVPSQQKSDQCCGMMVSSLAKLFKKKARPIISRRNTEQENVLEKEIPYITPDLSHLTVHELKILKEVLEKQSKFEADTDEFKRQLNDKVRDWDKRLTAPGKDRNRCQNCYTTKFVDGHGRICHNCKSTICGRCGLYTPSSPDPKQSKTAWRCKVCWYNMEFYHKTGFWYHGSRSELVVNRRELMGSVMENLKSGLSSKDDINHESKLPGLDDESKWILLRHNDNHRPYPWCMGILILGGVLVGKDTTYAVIDNMERETELEYESKMTIGDIVISWDGHTLINKSFEEVRSIVSTTADAVCIRVCRATESAFVQDLRMIPDTMTGENNFIKIVLSSSWETFNMEDTRKVSTENTKKTLLSVQDTSADDMESSQEITQEAFNDNPRNGRIKLSVKYHDSGRLEVYIAEAADINPDEITSDSIFYVQLCFITQDGEISEVWTSLSMDDSKSTKLEWNQLYSCTINHNELLKTSLAVILWQLSSNITKVREVIVNPERAALEVEPQWYQLYPHDDNFFELPSPPCSEKVHEPEMKNIQHAIPEAIVQDNDLTDHPEQVQKVDVKASAKLREVIAVKTLRKASNLASSSQGMTRNPGEDPEYKKDLFQRRRSSLDGVACKDVSETLALSYNDAQRADRTDSANISESGIMENYCFSGIRSTSHVVPRSDSVSSFCSYQDMTSTTDYSDTEVKKQESTSGTRFRKKRGRTNSKSSLLERLLLKGRLTENNDKIFSCPPSPNSERYRRTSKNSVDNSPIPGDATPVRTRWQLNSEVIEDRLEAISQQNLGPGQIAANSGQFGVNISRNVGALQLTIREVENSLQLHIIRAVNLMATVVLPDTFVKIYLMEGGIHNIKNKKRNIVHKAKSRSVKNTKSPIYDFMLSFSNYKKSQVLYLTVWSMESSNRSKKRLIGDITIALDLVDLQYCVNRWYCLMSQQTTEKPIPHTRPRLSIASTNSMSSIDAPVHSDIFPTRDQRKQKLKQQRDRYRTKASSLSEPRTSQTIDNQGKDSAETSEADKISAMESDNSYLERDLYMLQSTGATADTTEVSVHEQEDKISAASETEFVLPPRSSSETLPANATTDDEQWF